MFSCNARRMKKREESDTRGISPHMQRDSNVLVVGIGKVGTASVCVQHAGSGTRTRTRIHTTHKNSLNNNKDASREEEEEEGKRKEDG